MEGLTYAALKYSTIARGRIAEIDTAAAEAAPGVVLVMTHRNAPKLNRAPPFMSKPKAAGPDDLPIMQDDRIHWNGQPVALVLAETQEQADHAQSLIRVTYEEQNPVIALAAAKAKGRESGVFMGEPLKQKVGDAEAALAAAPHKVDVTYTTPRHHHAPIELHACTLAWEGDTLRIHDASQAVAHEAWTIAQVFGLKENQVRLTSPFVGGGFGSKLLWQHQILAAAAAKLARRPVRIMLSREGVFRIVGGRTVTEQRVALGAQADGRLDALIHTGVVAMTPHNNMPEPFILPAKSVYASKTFFLDVETVRMNMVANTFMRAPGEAVGTFGLESAMDELAVELGLDPIELRIRNEPEKDPLTGLPFSQRGIVQAWRDGAARFGWDKRSATPGGAARGRLAHRHGLRHRHLSVLSDAGRSGASHHHARRPRDRRHRRARDGHGHRHGSGAGRGRTAGAALGAGAGAVRRYSVPGRRIGRRLAADSGDRRVDHRRSSGAGEGTSEARRQRLAVGRPRSQTRSAVSMAGCVRSTMTSRRESYASILGRARREEVTVEAEAPMPLELEHWSMHSHSALFCEVRVNIVTRRNARQPFPRLVRLRAHPQRQDGGEPVPRRHHHGARPRAHGGGSCSTSAAGGS